MPQNRVRIKKEMRLLGAIQVMNGLIVQSLGVIWTYLYVSESDALKATYIPLVAMLGYPFWAALLFVISGIFAIVLQKTPSYNLMHYTITISVLSACTAVVGQLLILMEFAVFLSLSETILWSTVNGKMLSEYMFIFITLELVVAAIVANWSSKANYTA